MSEREIVCEDLNLALNDLRREGFRLDLIYPADDPHSAVMSRGGETVRLTTVPGAERPSGTLPPFAPEFVLTRGGGCGEGRAGMFYRDLIPGRLGGRYIASHITIPHGGPVADWVHFHRVALQMIYVRKGTVRVVYEDQGEPFVMDPGDLVLQPPGIRHRVLKSSPGLEVIEISAPALHETFADHDLELPTGRLDSDRLFGRQRFLRHIARETEWTLFEGAETRDTAMRSATGGLAEVRTIRRAASPDFDFPAHGGELVFGFVLEGGARLGFSDQPDIAAATAFVIPPGQAWGIRDASPNFELLLVTTSRLD